MLKLLLYQVYLDVQILIKLNILKEIIKKMLLLLLLKIIKLISPIGFHIVAQEFVLKNMMYIEGLQQVKCSRMMTALQDIV